MPDQVIQSRLNDAFQGQCTKDGEEWTCCGYHANRAECTAFAITDDAVTGGRNNALVTATGDLKKMSRLFDTGTPPAGSWYLVREQRKWLKKQLQAIVKAAADNGRDLKEKPLRILEAGVASFVHHFTYVEILHDVLDDYDGDVRIELVVVDRCGYPLAQIGAVLKRLKAGVYCAGTMQIGGHSISIPSSLARLLDNRRGDHDRISTTTVHADLTDADAVRASLRSNDCNEDFDVITEHFLTSVLRKNIQDVAIRNTRTTYADLLRPGGSLLAAVGFRRRGRRFRRTFTALHAKQGLSLDRASVRSVWDPYGLTDAQIADFQRRDKVGVSLDNTLVRFTRDASAKSGV